VRENRVWPVKAAGEAVRWSRVRIAPAQSPRSEDGFVLIEILVSALVLTIASAGVIALLVTTTNTQAEQRHSSEAYALAQEDQARLSSMRLSTLNQLNEPRTVTLNKTKFNVRSRGVFINDSTSTPSCGDGTSSADYVEISSVVTWQGMNPGEKAKIVSILSPSNGSLDPNNGTLAVSVRTKQQVPVANVYVSGGNGAFAGFTDAAGCAVFADLPAGNYTAAASGEAAGVVNKNGSYTDQKLVTVVGGDTKTESFEFDRPGTIPVTFKYRVGSSTEFKASSADSIVASHFEMKEARPLWTPGMVRQSTVNAAPLFPFTSTYRLYAGSCSGNNPDLKGEGTNPTAVADVVAPAGGIATAPVIQLPAYDPSVWTGSSSSSKGSGFANADVWIKDANCTKGGNPVTRRYTTNSSGKLDDLSIPWGTYDLCVDTEPGDKSDGVRRKRFDDVAIKNLLASTTRDFYLGSGSDSEIDRSCR
jgi:Tfp pilus assembly protein PilV